MSEQEKKPRTRSHTLRDYTVTLVNGATLLIQSDDLRNARKAANERYGADVVSNVDYASKRRDYNTKEEKAAYANRRLAALDEAAVRAGFTNWRALEVAVKDGNGVTIPAKS